MSRLELRGVIQRYDKQVVVNGVDLLLQQGGIACLLGASGCGKTTLLRCIAGFEAITAGEIRIGDQVVSRPGWRLPPERRQVGMVFQDYALFPHLSVARNVAFGLQPGAGTQARVGEMLEVVGLAGLGDKYPHELSGGQQQRVALARALAPRPQLVLLDEPFSNLDMELRERLSMEVREILKSQGMTAILVTHDQHEAFAMADEIGVMHEGRIQQWDTPYNLYHRPASRYVADFIGKGVFLPGTVLADRRVEIEIGVLAPMLPTSQVPDASAFEAGSQVDVLLRPDDVVHQDDSPIRARVMHKMFRGADILYTLQLASGHEVLSLVPSHHNHALGESIGIELAVDHVIACPRA